LLQAERYLVLDERGRTSRYRLVQQHVAAALGSGGSIDECRRLLARLTVGALPVAVDERLASWHARYGAVAVRPAVLVEARSEDELDAALAEDSVQPFIQRRLGPLAAEVAAADALPAAQPKPGGATTLRERERDDEVVDGAPAVGPRGGESTSTGSDASRRLQRVL